MKQNLKQSQILVALWLRLSLNFLFQLIGCAEPIYYRWTSDAGRSCFYQCQSKYFQCNAYCNANYSCADNCNLMQHSCYASCPDLYIVPTEKDVSPSSQKPIERPVIQDCKYGYRKDQTTNKCEEIFLPSHSHLNPSGNDFECNSGYKRDEVVNVCDKESTVK